MEHIREYLLSVTAAAILAGIIRSMAGEKGSTAGIVRLVCGIFLAFTVMGPFADIRLRESSLFQRDWRADAHTAVEEGQDYARRAKARLIKEQAEAYILDKARAFQASISAEVTVSDDETPIPISCRITGNLSPYAKQQMISMIETDLGIPKEAQDWTK